VASSLTRRKFEACCGWSKTTQPRSGIIRQAPSRRPIRIACDYISLPRGLHGQRGERHVPVRFAKIFRRPFDEVALLNAERDVVKDGVLVVTHGDIGGGNQGGPEN